MKKLSIVLLVIAFIIGGCASSNGYYKANRSSNNGCGGNAVPVYKIK